MPSVEPIKHRTYSASRRRSVAEQAKDIAGEPGHGPEKRNRGDDHDRANEERTVPQRFSAHSLRWGYGLSGEKS
jgi:hypothetical protein